MEEKKNTGLVVVVALLCLLIGGVGGYLIANNYMNKSETDNKNITSNPDTTISQNQTVVEDNTQSKCKYQKLNDVKYLSDIEKDELIKLAASSKTDLDKNYTNVDIFWKSDYLYEVVFSYDKCVGRDDCDPFINVLLWKENNAWKNKYYKPFEYAPDDQVAIEKVQEIENSCK